MAIYDRRRRAVELEELGKAGARAVPPPERAEFKDLRREAAGVRRDIPENVRELRNDPDRQTGTGASSNPLRGPNESDMPAAAPGEPSGSVSKPFPEPGYSKRLGRGPATDSEVEAYYDRGEEDWDKYAPDEGVRRENEWEARERRTRDREEAEQGDEKAQKRVELENRWKDTYNRMTPEEQRREVRRQDDFAWRQQRMDDFLREHPGFRIDENGEIHGDDVSPAEDRRLKRMMRDRDRAQDRINEGQRPYTPETTMRPVPRGYQRGRGR